MKEQILSQIVPLLITFVIGALVAIIKAVGDVLVSLIQSKKDEVLHRIAQGKHDAEVKTAFEVWNIVDEHFRVSETIGDTIQLKINMFNDLLLEKIPSLKQADIDYLRQTVAGEVNKFKEVLKSDINNTI